MDRELSHKTANRKAKSAEERIAELTLIFPGQEEEINIFIHGYSAVSSQSKFERLAHLILSARPPGLTYLLYWRSGSWKLPAWTQTVFTISRTAYRVIRAGEMFSPVFLLADAAMLTVAEMLSYRYYERRAETLGKNLRQHVAKIPEALDYPINLIGHSLGARVIYYALFLDEWWEYDIKDCILLGGAADVEGDWETCLTRISGGIYNAYSKWDLALKITPDMRKRVGRHPIQSSPRMINRQYTLQHTDYWSRLDDILPNLWEGFRPSPHIPLLKALKPLREKDEM